MDHSESRPDNAGYQMIQTLNQIGIPTTLIMDCAVAHYLHQVDAVFVGMFFSSLGFFFRTFTLLAMINKGAEAVVENGGIVNKIGTFQIAIAAR
jgi:translation initiation factor eIF-2B subunit alpha